MKHKQINTHSKRINVKQFLILIMFALAITSCEEEESTDHNPISA